MIANVKKTLWSANNHGINYILWFPGPLKTLHKSETRALASNGGFCIKFVGATNWSKCADRNVNVRRSRCRLES